MFSIPISEVVEPKILPLPSSPVVTEAPANGGQDRADTEAGEWPVELTRGGAVVRIFRNVAKSGYVSYTLAFYRNGKRERETASNEVKARKRAREVLQSLAGGESEVTTMRLQDVRAYQSAVALLAPAGVSLETACREYVDAVCRLGPISLAQVVREYSEALKLLGGVSLLHAIREYHARHAEMIEGRTVGQVADELIAAKEQGRAVRAGGKAKKVSEKYVRQVRVRLDKIVAGVKGPITEVTGKQLNDFVLSLKGPKGEKLTGRTRNNYIETLRQLFTFAKKQRYIARDCAVMDELERCDQDEFEIEIFSPEEIRKLLAAASRELAPVMAIGAFAGLRYFELTRLDWTEVKLTEGHIEVKKEKAKTRSRRLVPISRNLVAWLEEYRKESGPVWCWSDTYLSQCQLDCAKAAGVKWKHNALRHSFISYRVAQLKNVAEVALEAGNSPDMIFQHYRELVTADAAKTWFAITPATATEP